MKTAPQMRFAKKKEIISQLLTGQNVPESGIAFIAKTNNPAKVEKRLAALNRAGIPLTGLVWKIGMGARRFNAMIRREKRFPGLGPNAIKVKAYLRRSRVATEICEELARRNVAFSFIQAKVKFLRKQRLDPKRYGVQRIPVEYWQRVLLKAPSDLKIGIKEDVLWPLEDAHAKKLLEQEFPHALAQKSYSDWRPATVLEKMRAGARQGILPKTMTMTRYSRDSIARGKVNYKSSLDERGILDTAIRTLPGNRTEKRDIDSRIRVLDEIITRPNAAMNYGWLQSAMTRNGMSQGQFKRVIRDLVNLGVLSRRNGQIAVSLNFRGQRARRQTKKPMPALRTF